MSDLGAPLPRYSSFDYGSSDAAHGQVSEENEFGEMKTPETSSPSKDVNANGHHTRQGQMPSGTPLNENINDYGEISDRGAQSAQDDSRKTFDRMRPSDFGKETEERSEAFQSDQVYPENRFGELGRADTQYEELSKPSTSDKFKGTAEQLIGKVIGNKELHDKGVARKSPVMAA